MAPALSSAFRFESPDPEAGLRAWDEASSESGATYCHGAGWLQVFAAAYRKRFRIFIVRDEVGRCRAIAALIFFRGPLSGKIAVALPYLDFGGPLATDAEAEKALLAGLLREIGSAGYGLELRSHAALSSLSAPDNSKVLMRIPLAGKTEESYWKALDAKVRNQVRKAEKSDVTLRTGGAELLDDFYRVFGINMRDLGSPVHARKFFAEMLARIPGCEIVTAYRKGRCVGGLIRLQRNETLAIPWASTLRAERLYCPNNALYYDAIRAAIGRGLLWVDLGRSTRDEGTYKFKKQWLAEEHPLYWYQFDDRGTPRGAVAHAAASRLRSAALLWSKMPVSWANWWGARIRPGLPA